MEYEDRLTIETPEGVELELTLAGIGSRFIAALFDNLVEGILIGAIALALFLGLGGDAAVGIFVFSFFLVFFGYDIVFEVLASGRTPGKRLTGLRVVRTGGQPITFLPSAIRNLMRLVDILPTTYLIGCISILVTERNQRLGDLVADTIVVRERRGGRREPEPAAALPVAPPAAAAHWDVSAITRDELVAVRSFLERRYDLTWDARVDLARTLATPLRQKVVGAPQTMPEEEFLEHVAAAKTTRG